MTAPSNEKLTSIQQALLKKEDIQIIVQHWTRIFNIKFGWINDFDKLIINYVMSIYLLFLFNNRNIYVFDSTVLIMLDTFRSTCKLLNTFNGHTTCVNSIDYLTFDDCQYICSGSNDNTVRIWDLENNKQIQSFNGHSNCVYCVKFSPYHYYKYRQNVICSLSADKTIRFWDFKHNKQLKVIYDLITDSCSIEFSSFNCGRYLFSALWDKTIHLFDVETSKSLHVFNGHENAVWCIDISPLQSNNTKRNSIGNGYTICSGSFDKTIRIWDIETAKQLILFKGHKYWVRSVRYGSNELLNTILSGSVDKSVRLWDIRSGQQIQMFNGHTRIVCAVEYSPFVVKNIEFSGNSNVICSGSNDNTIRFWDIRSNKNELHVINGSYKDKGILCLKFVPLKKKGNNNEHCCVNLYYGSNKGFIHVWG
ncbi:WD-40 repeat protein [Reticulomyxa filosa]|uniref:WD-40 repeat protein n=1 Tax=Reticulomyxa filosa TaxID=46433 RepID=X6MJG8_RETFI|nr:WD-40 repeat protein [Reticulomyxa filosa]|eukprot:ETO14158.1 WD-40 repeat protein [Reticulomyxa filosa]